MPILSSLSVACARAFGFGSGDLFAGAALALDFDKTTTLDARISFTRATSATYFDSSGVLQTASSGAARFDHRLEGGVWVNKGLLIEEQRTNVCLQSENLGTTWVNTNTTESLNATDAPDGNTTADALLETVTNGGHTIYQDIASLNMTSTAYTLSCFVKANGRTKGNIRFFFVGGNVVIASFDLTAVTIDETGSTGTDLGATIDDVGDGWFKLTLSGFTGSSGTHRVQLGIRDDDGNTSYAGDVTKGLYFWGMQLEVGAFPTSYIKTTTASVTRNKDEARMTSTNFSSWYNATEGTTFWQGDTFSTGATAGVRSFSINNNSTDERIILSPRTSGGDGFASAIIDGNVLLVNLSTPDPKVEPTPFQTYKHSFAYKVNDFAASLDGGAVATDTSGTLPTVDRIFLGSSADVAGGAVLFLNGHIAKFYYWNTRKSNSFLQNITS